MCGSSAKLPPLPALLAVGPVSGVATLLSAPAPLHSCLEALLLHPHRFQLLRLHESASSAPLLGYQLKGQCCKLENAMHTSARVFAAKVVSRDCCARCRADCKCRNAVARHTPSHSTPLFSAALTSMLA